VNAIPLNGFSLKPVALPSLFNSSALTLPVLPAIAAPSVSAAPRAVQAAAPLPGANLREVLTAQSAAIEEARSSDKSGLGTQQALDRMFFGSPKGGGTVGGAAVVNDEGIPVTGRAAEYYREIRRIVDRYEGRVDFRESLDVMDDSYGDVWAKLKALDSLSKARGVDKVNTHLEGTLLWVDGVLSAGGKRTAVNTYRVYFHRSANPRSEIEEGIRRADGYVKEAVSYLARKGKAEEAMGRIDDVLLAFDVRGYPEVKEHLKALEREVSAQTQGRFRFAFLDEMAATPKDEAGTRRELNELIDRFQGDAGLDKIIEGVIYSRYVGLLLELKTLERYLNEGYSILQSGHELFDADGKYVTEIDVVVRSPEGKVQLVEAKSARVPLPMEEVLKGKVVAKLETYAKHRAQLEREIGAPIDEVVFSFDVGFNKALQPFLNGKAAELSRQYGFPVKFLFIESSPKTVKLHKKHH
jgi:hypothetical protein